MPCCPLVGRSTTSLVYIHLNQSNIIRSLELAQQLCKIDTTFAHLKPITMNKKEQKKALPRVGPRLTRRARNSGASEAAASEAAASEAAASEAAASEAAAAGNSCGSEKRKGKGRCKEKGKWKSWQHPKNGRA